MSVNGNTNCGIVIQQNILSNNKGQTADTRNNMDKSQKQPQL